MMLLDDSTIIFVLAPYSSFSGKPESQLPPIAIPIDLFPRPCVEDPGDIWALAELDELVTMVGVAAKQQLFIPDPLMPISKDCSEAVFNAVVASIGKSS